MIKLFKPFTDLIERILKNPNSLKKKNEVVSDLESLEENKNLIKSAFDNDLMDLDEYVEKMDSINTEINKIKNKSQSYADAIIRNSKGEILLLRRSITDTFHPDTWSLPGGKIEKDENPEGAVIREVKEETNLDIINCNLVLMKKIDTGFIYYFECNVNDESSVPTIILDTTEHINFGYFDKQEWVNMDLILDLKDTLNSFDNVVGYNFDLFPVFGYDKSRYSNIIEEIANIHPVEKDVFMLELFINEVIDGDDYVDYVEKAYKDNDHKNQLSKISGSDNSGKKIVKWVSKSDLKKLATHAKNASHKDLEIAIKESKHPQLREHAHLEIKRREKEEEDPEEKEGYEAHEYHDKEFKYNSEQDAHLDEEGNKANPAKLYQYYDQRHKEQDNKLQQLNKDLEGSTKQKQALGNKLKKAYYQKINKTRFAGDEESCYKTAMTKLESMGMSEVDIEPERVKKIISKKINKNNFVN